jgi:hypothetical protein
MTTFIACLWAKGPEASPQTLINRKCLQTASLNAEVSWWRSRTFVKHLKNLAIMAERVSAQHDNARFKTADLFSRPAP